MSAYFQWIVSGVPGVGDNAQQPVVVEHILARGQLPKKNRMEADLAWNRHLLLGHATLTHAQVTITNENIPQFKDIF